MKFRLSIHIERKFFSFFLKNKQLKWTYYKQNGLFVSVLVAYVQLSPVITMPTRLMFIIFEIRERRRDESLENISLERKSLKKYRLQ